MKARAVLPAAVGLLLVAWLLWRAGLTSVSAAVERLGPGGFAALGLSQLGLALLAGAAWALIGRGLAPVPAAAFIRARLVREAATQALPFTQVGGVALGGRALALEGAPGGFATAVTITDMAVEFTAQVAYAALGAGLLTVLKPHNPLGRPVLGVIAALALMAGGLLWAQARGAGVVERLAARLLRRDPAEGFGIGDAFVALRRRPLSLLLAWVLHLGAWGLTGVQTWATLHLIGVGQVGLAGALVIDSLTSAARALAFLAPGALGVQEGALVLLGALFGAPPAASLALSLIRRGRDLALGLPVLLIWQARQGGRIWRFAAPGRWRRARLQG